MVFMRRPPRTEYAVYLELTDFQGHLIPKHITSVHLNDRNPAEAKDLQTLAIFYVSISTGFCGVHSLLRIFDVVIRFTRSRLSRIIDQVLPQYSCHERSQFSEKPHQRQQRCR